MTLVLTHELTFLLERMTLETDFSLLSYLYVCSSLSLPVLLFCFCWVLILSDLSGFVTKSFILTEIPIASLVHLFLMVYLLLMRVMVMLLKYTLCGAAQQHVEGA